MKKRDDTVYLHDILDAIRQIESYVEGFTYEQFGVDRLRQDGVVRQLEIIGEAAPCLTEEFRSQHAEIPWKEIIGTRHKIVHQYFEVHLETVWDTIFEDLPPLKKWVSGILGEVGEEERRSLDESPKP